MKVSEIIKRLEEFDQNAGVVLENSYLGQSTKLCEKNFIDMGDGLIWILDHEFDEALGDDK